MTYNTEDEINNFFLNKGVFDNTIRYRVNLIFLSILTSYIVYVSPLYAIKSNLPDLVVLVLAQSMGMILISHIIIAIYASSLGSLLRLWPKDKGARRRLSFEKYRVKVMVSDILVKTLLVFFISSLLLSQDSSLIFMGVYFFVIKLPEIKKTLNKKYSEIIFSLVISFSVVLISISFVSAVMLGAIKQIAL